MKVILKQDIVKLGIKGEVCDVKKGYAKNYLLPRGLAVLATSKAIAKIQDSQKQIEKRKEQESEKAKELIEKIKGINIKMQVKVGEKQQMFAAIRENDISEAIKEQKKIELKPEFINLTEPIKELGEHDITVDYGEGLSTSFKLKISEEK